MRKYVTARDGGRASGPAFGVTLHHGELDRPRRWRRPRRIFVNSMGNLFHEEVPFEFIDRVFETIAACPQHIFQVLTKRAERMRASCEQRYEQNATELAALRIPVVTYAEISATGASRRTVERQVLRARRKLRPANGD